MGREEGIRTKDKGRGTKNSLVTEGGPHLENSVGEAKLENACHEIRDEGQREIG